MEKSLIRKVAAILTTFRALNPTMSIQVAHTFLLVALYEGSSLTEITQLSGFKFPTVSRNILDLGTRNRKREPGLGLVEATFAPLELRRKSVKLTPKGKALLSQLNDIIKV
jgi:DNA-binding MarR family transcriptional regulator